MATASSALPPPGAGGGFPSPAPAQAPAGGAADKLSLVRAIVSASRLLGQMVPGAVPVVRQINDLAQQLMQQVVASQAPEEPAAPPQ